MTTTITTASRHQLAAALDLLDACGTVDEARESEPMDCHADREERWNTWHDREWRSAWDRHDDAEAAFRRAYPNADTRPEAHEVVAAHRAATVALLREHVIETVTQVSPFDEPGTNEVVVDCMCGATVRGFMPEHLESTFGALQHVMAEHLASILAHAARY
ncbi:hypothetical protein ACFWU5_16570 [Nocardia sp. NPDC058640]|uniref:hypothetical protein n=1 Tax=Nocardia sp. NPDC058640 TaxID=3346571 RepID=UPI0036524849